ncbi:O-antigen polymerase [Arcticibacter tournemirensis]|uniref:Oligosaccharide repeat unit polymerase n=2 Tax=Pseudomonadati TaxID=3379134 RepID=A0A4Q0M8E5_9SPHI|nr:O-antigen polymerase [Arcticibacter tournemirensis]RXF69364.1 oligosaccharide repeat unit polymerase [Arcticibacter tournemirensis]
MNQSFILFINLFIYIFSFIIVLKSNYKGKNFALLIFSLFLVSSLCSLLYYRTSLYYALTEAGSNDMSLFALLFLFLNVVVFFRPILSYAVDKQVTVPDHKILYYLGVFLGIVSILPFVENIVHILGFNSARFADVYYEKMDANFDSKSHLSSIGKICNGIVSWFQYITPSLFFYMLASKRKVIFIFLTLIAFLNPVSLGLIVGGRGELFQMIFILVLNYLLFRQYFTKKQDKVLKLVGLFFCVFAGSILFFITIARADGNSDLVYEQIYRYLGEGFINFGEKGWYITNHTHGYSIANGTGQTFMKDISDYFDARDYPRLGSITGMRMYVYYTVFGDYFIDFGLIGGILFNVILALLFYLSVKGKEAHFSSLILFNLYAKIGFIGIYCYAYMYKIEFLFFSLLVVFVLRKFENADETRYIKVNEIKPVYAIK